ncbi:cellulose biosynthesis protein BcsN [Oceanicella sp. SM1341]|uniref:cellulose biosynthesis protein BcsN n=1 Tax=Oceanicella sp. SM1341 TaxID=1548889 RepID=UPI000E504D54|nr:cellulose biosynthesis protein BcsN [Oceanicella sp. SM1341]
MKSSTHPSGLRLPRALAAGLALLTLVAGCTMEPRSLEEIVNEGMWNRVPLTAAWVPAPNGLMVLQRSVDGHSSQRITLANETALEGENFIQMRAGTGNTLPWGRPAQYDIILTDIGGSTPSPFEDLEPGQMFTGRDALGAYTFASEAPRPGVNCVYVVRRLEANRVWIQTTDTYVDFQMRNCVPGPVAQAMIPFTTAMTAGTLARGPQGTAPDALPNLSPFAAPTQ